MDHHSIRDYHHTLPEVLKSRSSAIMESWLAQGQRILLLVIPLPKVPSQFASKCDSLDRPPYASHPPTHDTQGPGRLMTSGPL